MSESTADEKFNNQKKDQSNPLNSNSLPLEFTALISGIIPNTKYFDARFDMIQLQIDELRRNDEESKNQLKDFKKDVDKRFEQVDKRFDLVDKRFEQVDKRFEQVDKRFEQIIASIDKLGDKLEYRDRDQRRFTINMFTISIMVSVLGVLGAFLKILGVF